MIKPITIAKAWLQVLKGITTEEHRRRAAICNGCESKKYSTFTDFINDELEEVKGFVCGECLCPLIAKIRSTDKCKKWE